LFCFFLSQSIHFVSNATFMGFPHPRDPAADKRGLPSDPRVHQDPGRDPLTRRPFAPLLRSERHDGVLCPVCEEALVPLIDNLGSDDGALERALREVCDKIVPNIGKAREDVGGGGLSVLFFFFFLSWVGESCRFLDVDSQRKNILHIPSPPSPP
jgi:hypothetical protein